MSRHVSVRRPHLGWQSHQDVLSCSVVSAGALEVRRQVAPGEQAVVIYAPGEWTEAHDVDVNGAGLAGVVEL